jgi:hypothetical protein
MVLIGVQARGFGNSVAALDFAPAQLVKNRVGDRHE